MLHLLAEGGDALWCRLLDSALATTSHLLHLLPLSFTDPAALVFSTLVVFTAMLSFVVYNVPYFLLYATRGLPVYRM
jgi:hypothetical protein